MLIGRLLLLVVLNNRVAIDCVVALFNCKCQILLGFWTSLKFERPWGRNEFTRLILD
jgi:hypothetical protein